MPIYDQSYAHWDGKLEGRLFRWLPITLNEIKLAFRSKIFIIIFCLCCAPFVVRLGMVYIYSLVPQLEQEREFVELAQVDGRFMYGFLVFNQLISIIAMCLFVGCGLISKDLKARALEIYFSKPITMLDYVAGKLATMFFFIACMTLFPSLLLYISDFLLRGGGTFLEKAQLLVGICASSIVITVTVSLVALAASALCKSTRNAAILWIGFHLVLTTVGEILKEIFRISVLELIDIQKLLAYVCQELLRQEERYLIHWAFPVLYLLLINMLAGWILLRRVQAVEADAS
jgi:ABC-type transport system involved in multi-copper enzyme maturation permease subunit